MDAGPELDALVATRVLGWLHVARLYSSDSDAEIWHGNKPGTVIWARPPEVSTSWDAMREVVEAMRKRGFFVRLVRHDGIWWATFWYSMTGDAFYNAKAEILPHAVCEAAIAAMEAE